MAKPRFTLYKHIKIGGDVAILAVPPLRLTTRSKPHIVVVGGTEEKHEDGSYCVRHKNQWIEVGKRSSRGASPPHQVVGAGKPRPANSPRFRCGNRDTISGRRPKTYFKNLENRGVDAESIRCYRSGGRSVRQALQEGDSGGSKEAGTCWTSWAGCGSSPCPGAVTPILTARTTTRSATWQFS